MTVFHRPGVSTTYTPGMWGVYCIACSDKAQEFVFPCRLPEAPLWPPYLLESEGTLVNLGIGGAP